MNWDVHIDVGYKRLNQVFDFTRADMGKVMAKARKIMRNRIAKGVGINGKKLAKYSKRYADYKRSLGKNPSIVNMEDSGDLINGIRTTVLSELEGEITPTLHSDIGYYHQSGTAKGGKKREWFGFSDKDEVELTEYIKRILDAKIRKFNAR